MIYINEWLPNPVGTDAAGEFIELYNSGSTTVPLAGWRIGTGTETTTAEGEEAIAPAKTKPAPLTGIAVPPGDYLVLKHADDGISLKNTGGALLLYGPDGKIADDAAFHGTAPEGQSYSRLEMQQSGALAGNRFMFTDPTPGTANAAFGGSIAVVHHPAGVPLNAQPAIPVPVSAACSAMGFGALLAVIFTYAAKKNGYLSDIFFGRNEAPRRGIFEAAFRRAQPPED